MFKSLKSIHKIALTSNNLNFTASNFLSSMRKMAGVLFDIKIIRVNFFVLFLISDNFIFEKLFV